jgi:hypothetical protein
MKIGTWQIHGRTGSRGDLRRRTQAKLAALQRVAELVSEALNAGFMPSERLPADCPPAWYMPRPLAPVFIARIGKRSAFRLSLPAAHVR